MAGPNVNNIEQTYASAADYSRLQELLRKILKRQGPPCYTTPGDLDWWYARIDEPNFLSTVAIWRSEDQIVAFSWPARGWPTEFFSDAFVDPDFEHLWPTVIDFGEAWCRREGGGQYALWAFDGDATRVAVLNEKGYVASGEVGAYRLRQLDSEPVVPTLPSGFVVSTVTDADIESRVRAQQSAFDSDLTVEQYRRVRQSPTYRADLDFIVKRPDGDVVAFCTVWLDASNSYAVFEPVGSHKAHQRKGFGMVVIRAGMHRLWEMGVKRASVLGGAANTGAGEFYQSTGLELRDVIRCYEKRIGSS